MFKNIRKTFQDNPQPLPSLLIGLFVLFLAILGNVLSAIMGIVLFPFNRGKAPYLVVTDNTGPEPKVTRHYGKSENMG